MKHITPISKKICLINSQKKINIDTSYIQQVIEKLEYFVPKIFNNINIVLVSDRKIKLLNNQFLGKNYPTDVLSFNLGSTAEIIISVETAQKQAKLIPHSIEDEIIYLIIHGVLHISGYNDNNPKNYDRMKSMQDKIFLRVLKNVITKRKNQRHS
ncbi:MAG: rRNA maturation RNase YbeY [Candidatus Omnitrophica bacterium]|nr:rRNA maturation RNase YbeY [Candidatus Omnitrophota bacterium]